MPSTGSTFSRVQDPGGNQLRLAEPVIVLTCARSGSTLLRFILDSHPVLACPPETGIVDICTRMGVLSMLLEGPPTSARPGLSGLATAAIRSWVATTFGAYLIEAGKTRWCDKSLGSAESANRFLDVFPATKFICMYRNCMDLIDSALEANPFGLHGYGLDPYAAAHPGNSVGAIADYWVTHTRAINEFEKAHPGSCLRLRYEDLVADPEVQADRIFAFLGEAPVPGISRACLGTDREKFGPGDHKIWATSEISVDSVGRGQRIPLTLISPPVRTLIDGLLKQLGYPPAEQGAAAQASPAGQASAASTASAPPAGEGPPSARNGDVALDELEKLLAVRLSHRLMEIAPPGRRTQVAWSSFLITATVPSADAGGPRARSWRVDPATASLTRAHAREVGPGEWVAAGDAHAWRSVLSGDLNVGTAIRQGHLRYSLATGGRPDATFALRGETQAGTLARLLAPPAARQPTPT